LDFVAWNGRQFSIGSLRAAPVVTAAAAPSTSEQEHSARASLNALKLYKGKPAAQRKILQEVVATYPETVAAREAAAALKQIEE